MFKISFRAIDCPGDETIVDAAVDTVIEARVIGLAELRKRFQCHDISMRHYIWPTFEVVLDNKVVGLVTIRKV